ncbi:MFS transporter [Parabacteroides sp. PF5-6]|uniref:MFS transporter n=1 Tax=Parabacteroides sp. PF5-6 TaxID=1742403 RepID=UPI002405D2AB|nr:MFS transporter [Parabacteroides sp. PF5-6]MDF9829428.1 DHA3 family macrolide efflux protein-like MFS transporter [Parabacteroides sp. PF5-6]
MENWKKVFAIIWTGQFLSVLTSIIVNFAVILWISMETGSAEMLAWAAIAAILPQALLGPVTGVFIDRWNRKAIMILADSFIAFCTLILAVLFWLEVAEMWHIFILLAFRSVGSAFHMPAMQASIPLLAPEDQLTRIAGISQIINSVGSIAGPALGALFITIWDMQYVLLLDVVGAVIACTSLLFVHIPNPERAEAVIPNVLREMKEGIQVVLQNRGLSWVFLFSILVMLFLMPVSVLFPLMTLDHFGGDAFQVSLIEVVWGVGALLGGAIMGARVYKVNRVVLVNAMNVVIGLTFLLSGVLSPEGFVFFAVLTTIAGICGSVFNSAFTGLVQTYIRPDALGRVFSMFYTLNLLPSMIGLIGIGFFADQLGVATSFIVCGAVIIAIGLFAFFVPSAMRMDRG